MNAIGHTAGQATGHTTGDTSGHTAGSTTGHGVLVADIGSTVIKACVVTPSGTCRARTSAPAPGGTGAASQDPEALWQVTEQVLTATLGEWGCPVDALIVTGQGDGLWTIDHRGRAGVGLQWNSVAGARAVERWERDGTTELHYRATGTVLWPGTSAALWHHLREEDAVAARETRWILTASDWVTYRLTGAVTTDVTNATIPFLDLRTRTWDEGALDRLGCTELRGLLPDPAEPGSLVGTLLPGVARRLGLPTDTPVHLGCIDVISSVLGSGARRAGDAVAVLGTTLAVTPLTREPAPAGDAVGATVAWVDPDLYLRVLGSSSGGAVLEWFLRTHGYEGPQRYDRFWEEVASSSSASEVALPFLYGERVPFLAPRATGVFSGLTPDTTRADLARALAEGLSMALRQCLESAGELSSLVLTGGGSVNAAWCQLIADLLGAPVTVDPDPNMAMRGAASLVPGYSHLVDAGGERHVVEPGDRGRHDELENRYRTYRDLVAALAPTWKEQA